MSSETAIFLIKALHTAVFLFMSACILYVLRCGIVGSARRITLPLAIALPSGVGGLWWLNGRECLLSSAIYRLAGGDHSRPDIFLPDWIADRIMPVSTPLLAIGIGLVLWRKWTNNWRSRPPAAQR